MKQIAALCAPAFGYGVRDFKPGFVDQVNRQMREEDARRTAQPKPVPEPEPQPVPEKRLSSVDSAYVICRLSNENNIASDCDVSGWNKRVTLSIDISASQAAKICQTLPPLFRAKGLSFDPGWSLRITSPFSNGKRLAECAF